MSAPSGGAGCYLCTNRAVQSCRRCRRWFCELHGGLLLKGRCRTCDYDARVGTAVLAGIAAVALVWWLFGR